MLSLAAMRETPMKSRKIEPQICADQFTDEEIARRRDEALLRALSMPPKPHSEMKLGKRKANLGAKASPAKKRGIAVLRITK
jgi:hypothetical protein